MVIDEREVRACLILHVAFGLSLPPSLGPLDPSVKIPDFAGSLPVATLKKPVAYPYLRRILTLAMAKGMDSLCQMIIIQAAFPRSFDDPIFGTTGSRKMLLPSYLLLAIGLRRCSLVKLMVDDPSGRRGNASSLSLSSSSSAAAAGGALLNQHSWLGLTPLLVAAATGGKATTIMVRTLVEAGADPTVGIPLTSMVKMQRYAHRSRPHLAIVLDPRGPIKRVLPLDMACATESCDAVISILGAMTARAQDHRQAPLAECHLALLVQQDLDITIRLIKAEAPVSTARDHEGSTPLHWAARRGKTEMLAVLLHAGAPIDAVNRHGWTALHEAAWHGHADAIKYLISQGADCSLPDHRTGLTALQMALKSGIPSEDLCDYFGTLRGEGQGRRRRPPTIPPLPFSSSHIITNRHDLSLTHPLSLSLPYSCG